MLIIVPDIVVAQFAITAEIKLGVKY